MSRRTPIKELMAEESGTPSSPIRRSSRIAERRTSATDDNNDVDRLSVSSAGSHTRSRAVSRSPLTVLKDEDQIGPARRTRRRASTSSLIEEEVESITRSSPFPAKQRRRILSQSASCSPVSEMENKSVKTSTPQKEKTPSKRGMKLSSMTEPMVILEAIEEVETKSPMIEESRDEDLPFKKKKAVLLQTISENAPDLNTPVKSNGDVHAEEDQEHHAKKSTPNEKVDVLKTPKKAVLEEEKELVVLLQNISDSGKKEDARLSLTPKSKPEDVPKLNLHISYAEEHSHNSDKPLDTNIPQNVEVISQSTPSPVENCSGEPSTVSTDTVTPSKKSKNNLEESISEKDSFNNSESKSVADGREHEESTISADSSEANEYVQESAAAKVSPETIPESPTADESEIPQSPHPPSQPKISTPKKSSPSISTDSVTENSSKGNTSSKEINNDTAENSIEPLQEQDLQTAEISSSLNTSTETATVLVASKSTPLRRSPRLYTHGKDSPDAISSPKPKNQNENITPKKITNGIKMKETSINKSLNEDEKKLNKTYNSSIDMDLDPLLKEKIATLTDTLQVDSSSDEGSVTHFIDDVAEEGEEDTPSEGSNDIIDIGESVGSTASQIDSDESYEVDSFIDDNEDEIELLSGEEYDLSQEKPKKTGKLKRVLQIDSSDEEGKEKNQVNHVNDNDIEIIKTKDDSDIENMSTRPYCGLSPPTVISVRDSPESDERPQNNTQEEKIGVATLINNDDNLESLEHINEHNGDRDDSEVSEIAEGKSREESQLGDVSNVNTSGSKSKPSAFTPNNSIVEVVSVLPENNRRSKSSINIQENVSLKEITDGSLSDRLLKVVEVFCSTVNKAKDTSSGNISLNFSLDYENTSLQEENDEVVGRKRVLSESGVDFYLAKKRHSKEFDKGNEQFIVSPSKRKSSELNSTEKKETPTKKPKVDTNVVQATVEEIPSVTTKSPKGNDSPKKLKGKITVPSIVISESSHKKRKSVTVSPSKKLSLNDSQEPKEQDDHIDVLVSPQKKVRKRKQKNLTDSDDLEKQQTESTKKKNDYGLPITKRNSSPIKPKRDEFVEFEEVVEEIVVQSQSNEDALTSSKKKSKKLKEKKLVDSEDGMQHDIEIPAKKKSKKKHLESNTEDVQLSSKIKKDKKKKVVVEELEFSLPKAKEAVKSNRRPSSDSEMSDDLDKEIFGKYELDEERHKKKKNVVSDPKVPSDWQIQYLPPHIKKALAKSDMKKSIAKPTSEIVNISNKKPKLVPSSNNPSDSWQLDELNVSSKPTTIKKVPVVTQLHAKDFKTRATFDPKRVKRMETKELLKKKEKMM